MQHSKLIADRLREVFLTGKWIANTNYKEQIAGVNWVQATKQVSDLNTIALLTFHINYYLGGLLKVLNGGKLEISDRYSFDIPPIHSEADWQNLVSELLDNAGRFAMQVEQIHDEMLDEPFVDEKYGTWRRNLEAVIEHSYYHLGQVVLIRKMISFEQNQ
jgi:hypothetical protein